MNEKIDLLSVLKNNFNNKDNEIIQLIEFILHTIFNRSKEKIYEEPGDKISTEDLSLSSNKVKMIATIISMFGITCGDENLNRWVHFIFSFIDLPTQIDELITVEDELIYLFDNFSDIDLYINKTIDGLTFLHRACSHNLPKVINYLLVNGAHTDINDNYAVTPFTIALTTFSIEVVDRMYEFHNRKGITLIDIVDAETNSDKRVYEWAQEKNRILLKPYTEKSDPLETIHRKI